MDNEKMNVETILKYRAHEYDIHDTTYAKELNVRFSYVPSYIQNKFNTFTKNLMNDEQINRFCLLNAIDDFNKYNNTHTDDIDNENKIDSAYLNDRDWISFTDCAFNYRPYQSCMIM
jgi:hypothetical protein